MQNRKIKVIVAVVVLLSMLTAIGIFNHRVEQQQLENQQIQVQLKEYEQKIPQLLKELDSEKSDKNKIKQELEKTQSEYKALQARKAEERRIAQERAKNPVYASEMPSGDCSTWMSQAGITHPLAIQLIQKESGCNPLAVNPTSGACGIPQALPCSKLPQGVNTSPADQLIWMQNYVNTRYGGWDGAWSFWRANNWY